MTFVKKLWVTAEKISATELNRIETGIDDWYNQNVSDVDNIKMFEDALVIDKNPNGARIELMDGVDLRGVIGIEAAKGMYIDSLGGSVKCLDSSGSTENVDLGSINGVVVENHHLRHMHGGSDYITKGAQIIVGPDGDYATLQLALAAAVSGDKIYIEPGAYEITSNITISTNNLTIIGSGNHTELNAPAGLTYTIDIAGDNIVFENMAVSFTYATVSLIVSGDNNIVRGITIRNDVWTTTVSSIVITGSNNNVSHCTLYHMSVAGIVHNIYINGGDYNIISYNDIRGLGGDSKCVSINSGYYNIVKGNYIYEGNGTTSIAIDVSLGRAIIEDNYIDDFWSGIYSASGKTIIRNNIVLNIVGTAITNLGAGSITYGNIT